MIRRILSFYSWSYARQLVLLYAQAHYRPLRYVSRYWQTADFSRPLGHAVGLTSRQRFTLAGVRLAGGLCLLAVMWSVVLAARGTIVGGWYFSAALAVAYPLLAAHAVPLVDGLWWVAHPKRLGRAVLCSLLEAQVVRLRRRHQFKVIAVAGSVGKTSTKIAIAKLLQTVRRVRWQEGNYNDRVTVPLIFFGQVEPAIWNIPAWLRVLVQNEVQIRRPYPYQVVVAELGTDGPGFMREFAYIKPDIAVLTAITPEHMAFFGTLDAVAHEELALLHYAKRTFINVDDVPAAYLTGRDYVGYGLSAAAVYRVSGRQATGLAGQRLTFHLGPDDRFTVTIPLVGEHGAKIALAAAAAAHALHIPLEAIEQGVAAISAFAGRMHILPGILNSTLIDDTYNASPVAVRAALDVLQSGDAPQRIAILGSMNELGDYSPQAHREVAEYCDPGKLDVMVTIGHDANTYLAPVARDRGCEVVSFLSPYAAGQFVRERLREGAVVLAKGSQNQVFAEEALKPLLADSRDTVRLVRQSAYWMAVKRKQFSDAGQK